MGQILTTALLTQRAATEAAALALHNVPSYRPQHGPNGGEMAATLHTLPVLVKYELTDDGRGGDMAEVSEVSISGHLIDAGDFAADIRAEWARECMTARAKAGLL